MSNKDLKRVFNEKWIINLGKMGIDYKKDALDSLVNQYKDNDYNYEQFIYVMNSVINYGVEHINNRINGDEETEKTLRYIYLCR